jgi:K+-sensing histidine kinase KdpD
LPTKVPAAVVRMSDDGMGIEGGMIQSIFDMFVRRKR